jgi:hypothetical protein
VFTDAETAWIRDVSERDERDRRLWTLWAAKETAFKIVSKLLGAPPVFIHRTFVCEPDKGDGPWGRVTWQDRSIDLVLAQDEERLHMVGWESSSSWSFRLDPHVRARPLAAGPAEGPDPRATWEEFLAFHFTAQEADPIHSIPSAMVRLAARSEAAETLGARESRLQLICGEGPKGRTPPRLLLDDRLVDLDVSLSHHGRFIAWVLGPGPDRY